MRRQLLRIEGSITTSKEDRPVLEYQPPATELRGATRAAKMGAALATVCFLALAVLLWRGRATDSAIVALAGAIFCLLLAVGVVKTKQDRRS
jgi:hypothetical protein